MAYDTLGFAARLLKPGYCKMDHCKKHCARGRDRGKKPSVSQQSIKLFVQLFHVQAFDGLRRQQAAFPALNVFTACKVSTTLNTRRRSCV